MQKEDRRTIQNEFGEILNKVKRKKWSCVEYGCDSPAINSHLLQRNGILNYVAEDGKVVMIKPSSIFGLKKAYRSFCRLEHTFIPDKYWG